MYGHICSSLKCVPVNICPHVIMFVMLPENLEFKIFIKKYVHQFIALFWQALWFGNCLINPSYFLNNRRHFMLRTKNFFSTVGIFRKGPKNYIATFPLYWGYIYRAKSTCSQQICNMIFRKWGGGPPPHFRKIIWGHIDLKWPCFGHFGGTENGTSVARNKLPRPLFNTN